MGIKDILESAEGQEWQTNAIYRNKSGPFSPYFRKRCFVALWGNEIALVRFGPEMPLREVSRNHLGIDH